MDQEIIHKALKGDLSSFDILVTEHQDRWIRMAMSILGNQQDALDAFQDGLINVYRSLKSFRQEATFSTWSARVMLNAYLRHQKRLSSRRERETNYGGFDTLERLADSKSTDKDLMDRERTVALRNAIRRLPPRQQMAVTLKYDGQMTINQVAESLNCTPGTVKRYLHRAMAKLRKDLKNYFK